MKKFEPCSLMEALMLVRGTSQRLEEFISISDIIGIRDCLSKLKDNISNLEIQMRSSNVLSINQRRLLSVARNEIVAAKSIESFFTEMNF